ncbi:MAG TPA: signal peptidase II, partial [Acetobacteraceae bacterium]|nr:signal peptidase II [Acetobacteraceae bacterium]
DVHLGTWHWFVFNVADAAIVCGVAALVLESQWGRKGSAPRRQAEDNGA